MMHTTTLAGIAMRLFKSKFLREEELAIVPENGRAHVE